MFRKFLKGKIHGARVTGKELYYEGSLTLDPELMEVAGLFPFEAVWVYNVSNGNRFETYVIEGKRGSKEVILNGAAARMGEVGDQLIVVSYCLVEENELKDFVTKVVIVDEKNAVKEVKEVKVVEGIRS